MFNPIRTILFFVGNFMEFPHHWNHRMGVLNIRGMPLYILSWLPQQMRETKHNSPLGSEVLTNAQILFWGGPGGQVFLLAVMLGTTVWFKTGPPKNWMIHLKYPLVIKHGNGKSPINRAFTGKIVYK